MNEEQEGVVQELRELARATHAYMVDDSRSLRRRQAMLEASTEALQHADKVFGLETLNV